jgi:hypothetical protein
VVSESKKASAGNGQFGRYDLVGLAKEWMEVLSRSEDTRELGPSELVKKSLEDIVSGNVTEDEVHKARAKMKAAPAIAEGKEKRSEVAGESKKEG